MQNLGRDVSHGVLLQRSRLRAGVLGCNRISFIRLQLAMHLEKGKSGE